MQKFGEVIVVSHPSLLFREMSETLNFSCKVFYHPSTICILFSLLYFPLFPEVTVNHIYNLLPDAHLPCFKTEWNSRHSQLENCKSLTDFPVQFPVLSIFRKFWPLENAVFY